MQDSDQFFTGHSAWNWIKVLWLQVCFLLYNVQWSLLTTGVMILLRKGSFLLAFVLLVFCFAGVFFGRVPHCCSINIAFVRINKTFEWCETIVLIAKQLFIISPSIEVGLFCKHLNYLKLVKCQLKFSWYFFLHAHNLISVVKYVSANIEMQTFCLKILISVSCVEWWAAIEGQDQETGNERSRVAIVLAVVSASTAIGAERRSATTNRSVTGKRQSEVNAKEPRENAARESAARESAATENAATANENAARENTGRAELVDIEQWLSHTRPRYVGTLIQ